MATSHVRLKTCTQRTSLVVKKYWIIKKEEHNGLISFKSYTPRQLTVELFAKRLLATLYCIQKDVSNLGPSSRRHPCKGLHSVTLLRVICVKGLFYRVAQKVHIVDSSPTL
uniref:Uncharacterized protein n=1 Tax=Plectus sambesii TaxID=2011161 RepID=A0A914VW06_9BILA